MLVQEQDDKSEHAVHYLSKKLTNYEVKYTLVEKICAAMVWLTKTLWHYFQSYTIKAVAKIDPMKYLYGTPSLVGKLSRWLLLLSEFDIEYITKKVIKGRAVAEFLGAQLIDSDYVEDLSFLTQEIPTCF
ncbi:hypothetical protein M5689_011108 [Euphorbia peplus]|nr:hypothetical protein M5689_011108 [Euphorbia peplus]